MKKIITFLLLISTALTMFSTNISKIRDVLKIVETRGNPDSIGDNGTSFGILQIQLNAIKDVNKRYNTHYTHQDAFNIKCAEEIFKLYTQMWSEHLEKKENRKVTTEDIVRIWNGGPRGYKRTSTDVYYEKYLEISKEMYFDKLFFNY
jgi:hypothetical protein